MAYCQSYLHLASPGVSLPSDAGIAYAVAKLLNKSECLPILSG